MAIGVPARTRICCVSPRVQRRLRPGTPPALTICGSSARGGGAPAAIHSARIRIRASSMAEALPPPWGTCAGRLQSIRLGPARPRRCAPAGLAGEDGRDPLRGRSRAGSASTRPCRPRPVAGARSCSPSGEHRLDVVPEAPGAALGVLDADRAADGLRLGRATLAVSLAGRRRRDDGALAGRPGDLRIGDGRQRPRGEISRRSGSRSRSAAARPARTADRPAVRVELRAGAAQASSGEAGSDSRCRQGAEDSRRLPTHPTLTRRRTRVRKRDIMDSPIGSTPWSTSGNGPALRAGQLGVQVDAQRLVDRRGDFRRRRPAGPSGTRRSRRTRRRPGRPGLPPPAKSDASSTAASGRARRRD